MSRMLSTATTWLAPDSACRNPSSSASTRSAPLLRKFIVAPFKPQNVQCAFAPHQQPRDVSISSDGCSTGTSGLRLDGGEILVVVGRARRPYR